jgi:hypothetical protein
VIPSDLLMLNLNQNVWVFDVVPCCFSFFCADSVRHDMLMFVEIHSIYLYIKFRYVNRVNTTNLFVYSLDCYRKKLHRVRKMLPIQCLSQVCDRSLHIIIVVHYNCQYMLVIILGLRANSHFSILTNICVAGSLYNYYLDFLISVYRAAEAL